jgi:hypothetical protein
MNDSAKSTMHHEPVRAMYDRIEDAPRLITMPLHSAIQADTDMPVPANGKLTAASGQFQRASITRTSPERLKSLAGCGDITSLKSAVQEICTEFGKVTRIDVLTMADAEKRRMLCFLRLESPAQERQLMNALGLPRFGDDVLVVVDLSSNSGRLVL